MTEEKDSQVKIPGPPPGAVELARKVRAGEVPMVGQPDYSNFGKHRKLEDLPPIGKVLPGIAPEQRDE